jgi:hypothetical protein
MINSMFIRLAPAVLLFTAIGEVGVTSSFSNRAREGTGTSQTRVVSLRTESGNSNNAAFRVEFGQLPATGGQDSSSGSYFATSRVTGSSNYTEARFGTFSDNSTYDFIDHSGSISVSAFAN